MKISEQTKIESQIGFTIGILLGALASWVFIIFFTTWEWYFKVFSSIGEIGIVGNLAITIWELIKIRKQFIEAQKAFNGLQPNQGILLMKPNSNILKNETFKNEVNYIG